LKKDMKIFLVATILFFTSLFVVPPVKAVAQCECGGKIEGLGCNIDKKVLFDFGTYTTSQVLEKVLVNDCNALRAVVSGISQSSYNIDETTCDSIVAKQFQLGVSVDISCKLVGGGATTGAVGTTGGATTGAVGTTGGAAAGGAGTTSGSATTPPALTGKEVYDLAKFYAYWEKECPLITKDLAKLCVSNASSVCVIDSNKKCAFVSSTYPQATADTWCQTIKTHNSCVVSSTASGVTGGGGADTPIIVSLINPMGGSAENPSGDLDMRKILGNIIAKGMGMLGGIALLVFIYGGFEWLTSAGSPEKVKKGSQAMVWAIIGLFLIFGAYAIIRMFFTAISAKESAFNPWGLQGFSGADTDKATEGCYCFEVTGTGSSLVKTPTKVIQLDAAMQNKGDCEKSNQSKPNLVECEWQIFTTGEKIPECSEGEVMVKGKCIGAPLAN
jgi:hypothetical protein